MSSRPLSSSWSTRSHSQRAQLSPLLRRRLALAPLRPHAASVVTVTPPWALSVLDRLQAPLTRYRD